MEQLKAAFNCDERLWMPAYLKVCAVVRQNPLHEIITDKIMTHRQIDFLFEQFL